MIGTTLSHYRVTERIGAGGMGEVYRATDTTLGRDVALKLLPAELESDPERLARFEREARLLASLNHPRIAAIHGFEQVEGKRFLVLELVEGEDLAARIARGPIPVDEAVEIARQIAEALEEAHEKGIVHRDLKPANVKLAPDGQVKVLDFGLAKAWAGDAADGGSGAAAPPDFSQSPTLAHAGTQAGVILGTAAYMSPEQARGKPVDRRADIWALGVVLFEMLTGRSLFQGETVSDVLAAVLTREPSWSALPAGAAHLRPTLKRCLERDPRRRLRDAGDLRLELEREPEADALTPRGERRTWVPVAAAIAGLAAGALAAVALLSPSATPESTAGLQVSIQLSPGQELAEFTTLAFTHDGRGLAIAARQDGERRILFRALDETVVTAVEGTEGGLSPFFSPDGGWLGFIVRTGELRRVPVGGGRPLRVADQRGIGAVWLADDTIVFNPVYSEGLFRVPATGGDTVRLTEPDRETGELGHWSPQALPGDEQVLFTAFRSPIDTSRVRVVTLETGEVRTLVEGGFYGRFVPTGHLLYVKGDTLFAAPFDVERTAVTGTAQPVLQDVYSYVANASTMLDVSPDGILARVPRSAFAAPRELIRIDRNGIIEPLLAERRLFRGASLSPDGAHVVTAIQGESLDLWTVALGSGTLSRLTSDEGSELNPLWTPDGREIVFTVDPLLFDVARARFGVAAEPEPLWPEPATADTYPRSISAPGLVAYEWSTPDTGRDIWVRPLDGGPPRAFRQTRYEEMFPTFSPDGAWLAYESDETGRPEIYVEAYPGPGDRRQVSSDGGSEPLWSRGGELFYRHGTEFRAIRIRLESGIEPAPAETLFSISGVGPSRILRSYDVSPDGRWVLLARTPPELAARHVELTLGWLDHLKELVPTPR